MSYSSPSSFPSPFSSIPSPLPSPFPSSPDQPQQQVITLKDTNRLTAACDACRERKRKCDGKLPCHFCCSRRITCQYSQRKKRGPPVRKKPETDISNQSNSNNNNDVVAANVSNALTTLRNAGYSLGTADLEYALTNRSEMNKYITFYVRCMNIIAPICEPEKLTAPESNEAQVQSYAVVAIASRMCGDIGRSKMCIGSARQLAGMIYDSPHKDAAVAMLLMSSYFQMDLDFSMTAHYINMSWSLLKLVPTKITEVLYLYIYTNYIVADKNLTNKQKEEAIRLVVQSLQGVPDAMLSKDCKFLAKFLNISVLILRIFDCNIFWPIDDMETHFQKIYHTIVSEEDRQAIAANVKDIEAEIERLDATTHIIIQGIRILTGVVMTVTEWKSGHDLEALSYAMRVTESLHILHQNNCLGFAADYTFICLLEVIVQFFREHNYHHQASKLSEFIRIMCKIMGPGYNSVLQFMDRHGFTSNLVDFEEPIIPVDPLTVFIASPILEQNPSPGPIPSPYMYTPNDQSDYTSTLNNVENLRINVADLEIPFTINEGMLPDLDCAIPLIDLDNIDDPAVIIEKVSFP